MRRSVNAYGKDAHLMFRERYLVRNVLHMLHCSKLFMQLWEGRNLQIVEYLQLIQKKHVIVEYDRVLKAPVLFVPVMKGANNTNLLPVPLPFRREPPEFCCNLVW